MSIKRKISYKVQFIQWNSTLQKKDNELLTHRTAWMHPETFILSESQQRTAHSHLFHFQQQTKLIYSKRNQNRVCL